MLNLDLRSYGGGSAYDSAKLSGTACKALRSFYAFALEYACLEYACLEYACLEYAGYNWSCRNDLRYMYYYPDIQRRETRFRQYGM